MGQATGYVVVGELQIVSARNLPRPQSANRVVCPGGRRIQLSSREIAYRQLNTRARHLVVGRTMLGGHASILRGKDKSVGTEPKCGSRWEFGPFRWPLSCLRVADSEKP